jgi:hypothetical protein
MERIKKDLTAKIENKLKKKVESMYKGNLITKEMKGYLIPKGSRPGKVQGNPKMHKKNKSFRNPFMISSWATCTYKSSQRSRPVVGVQSDDF